jgi:hypothetical protein
MEGDSSLPPSDRVINRIMNKRRARIDLAEDLNHISERLQKLNTYVKKYSPDNLKLDTMIDLLNSAHIEVYNRFLCGLELLIDTFVAKKNDECFTKISEVRDLLTKRNQGVNIYESGFNLNLATTNPLTIDLGQRCLIDYQDHSKIS